MLSCPAVSLGIASEGSFEDDKVVTKRHDNEDSVENLEEEIVARKTEIAALQHCVCVHRVD